MGNKRTAGKNEEDEGVAVGRDGGREGGKNDVTEQFQRRKSARDSKTKTAGGGAN